MRKNVVQKNVSQGRIRLEYKQERYLEKGNCKH